MVVDCCRPLSLVSSNQLVHAFRIHCIVKIIQWTEETTVMALIESMNLI